MTGTTNIHLDTVTRLGILLWLPSPQASEESYFLVYLSFCWDVSDTRENRSYKTYNFLSGLLAEAIPVGVEFLARLLVVLHPFVAVVLPVSNIR